MPYLHVIRVRLSVLVYFQNIYYTLFAGGHPYGCRDKHPYNRNHIKYNSR